MGWPVFVDSGASEALRAAVLEVCVVSMSAPHCRYRQDMEVIQRIVCQVRPAGIVRRHAPVQLAGFTARNAPGATAFKDGA